MKKSMVHTNLKGCWTILPNPIQSGPYKLQVEIKLNLSGNVQKISLKFSLIWTDVKFNCSKMAGEMSGKLNNSLIRRKSLGLSRRTRLGQGLIRQNQFTCSHETDSSSANLQMPGSSSTSQNSDDSTCSENIESVPPRSINKRNNYPKQRIFSSPATSQSQHAQSQSQNFEQVLSRTTSDVSSSSTSSCTYSNQNGMKSCPTKTCTKSTSTHQSVSPPINR